MRFPSRIPVLLAVTSSLFSGCASTPRSTADLVNTYWKLMSMHGEVVQVAENQREPYFVLRLDGDRVTGFGGCNWLTGAYRLDGDRLSFTETGGTLVACAAGMETERAFHATLEAVAGWKILGERLELFDARGHSLAKFESRYLY